MADIIRFKRGTYDKIKDYTPDQGEPIYDKTYKSLRIGDGSTPVNELPEMRGMIVNPADEDVLPEGVFGWDKTNNILKIGDGVTSWVDLEQINTTGQTNATPEGFVNVKDFGAKGDGETDDTDAIQDAINYAAEHSGVVFLPAGIYNISGVIILPEFVKLLGVNYLYRTHSATSGNSSYSFPDTYYYPIPQETAIVATSTEAIIKNPDDILDTYNVIEQIHFHNFNTALQLKGYTKVYHCTFTDCQTAILFPDQPNASNPEVIGNYFRYKPTGTSFDDPGEEIAQIIFHGHDGVFSFNRFENVNNAIIAETYGSRFINNEFDGIYRAIIFKKYGNEVNIVSNNLFNELKEYAIIIPENMYKIIIDSNNFDINEKGPIYLKNGAANINITNNIFATALTNDTAFIHAESATKIIISGNQFTSTSDYAIEGSLTKSIITNNVMNHNHNATCTDCIIQNNIIPS